MTDITWMQVLALMIGSGGITSGAVAITMKLIDRNSITKRTLAVLSYGALSDKIEKLLDQNYCDSGAAERIRRVLESIQGPRLEWGHGCENGKGSCTANKKFT